MKSVEYAMDRLAARKQLERQLAEGRPHPEEHPKRLHLQAIKQAPELFQFRKPLDHESRAHVADMARSVKERRTLAALLIWWGGDGWYCIDGHHRLDAYRVGKWPHQEPVPVSVYRGSVVRAMLTATHSNAPGKLAMTKQEQTQAAWELVVSTKAVEASAADIAKASCISARQVFSMRAVKRALLQKDPSRELAGMSWHQARQEHDGKDVGGDDVDWEAKDREEAQQWANKLVQVLGKRPQERPETLAMALELYAPRFPAFILEHWKNYDLKEDFEEEDRDF